MGTTITAAQHREAREGLIQAWARLYPDTTPTLQQLQGAQAISYHETGYGLFAPFNNKGGAPTFNMGAIQCPKLPDAMGNCPCQGFLHKDTRPNSDGSSTEYRVCFRSYDTAVDGAEDLWKQLSPSRRPLTFDAISRGDLEAISAAMYDERYYQGFGPTREARIAGHVKAMTNAVNKVATMLEEPIVTLPGGTDPVGPNGAPLGVGQVSATAWGANKRTLARVVGLTALAYVTFEGVQQFLARKA